MRREDNQLLARTTNSSHGGGLCVVARGGHIEGDLHVVCRHVPRAPLTACFIVCVAKTDVRPNMMAGRLNEGR